jgi:hypothetical protein
MIKFRLKLIPKMGLFEDVPPLDLGCPYLSTYFFGFHSQCLSKATGSPKNAAAVGFGIHC